MIDTHTHVIGADHQRYPLKPRNVSGEWYLEAPYTAEELLACMDEAAVAQEYEISLRVDGAVETHHVVGILYAEGDLLGGERIYGSERFVRLMAGELFQELNPIPPS